MELGPSSRKNTLFFEEVALFLEELKPFPKESTLFLREVALFPKELGPFLNENLMFFLKKIPSLCKLFCKVLHFFLRNFFYSLGIYIIFWGNLFKINT